MRSIKVLSLFSICLLLAVAVWAGTSVGKGTDRAKLELLPSKDFDISHARLDDVGKQPHLQYKVVNTSETDIPKMMIELMAYDSSNRIVGGMRWNLSVDLKAGSSTNGILAAETKLVSASRMTLKFEPLASSGTSFECGYGFCGESGECGKMASLCTTGISSFGCQQGTPCACKFVCQPAATK